MRWDEMLQEAASYLRPPEHVVSELEAFRKSIGAAHEEFAIRITSSPWATRQVLLMSYEAKRGYAAGLKQRVTETELVQSVYSDRQAASPLGSRLPALPPSCRTIEDLIKFVVRVEDDPSTASPDPFQWGKRIDAILEESR